eukprot:4891317-Pyramimonas_sp.AAC.1
MLTAFHTNSKHRGDQTRWLATSAIAAVGDGARRFQFYLACAGNLRAWLAVSGQTACTTGVHGLGDKGLPPTTGN